ncbi:MAG: HNH endonuclease [Myxococcales bacterium]|nr:HNH endonuclease [Myxococcales bacterium]
MFVFVQNQHGVPLMPCSPAKARRLLHAGKAKVLRRTPFTLKLLYGCSGYKQPVVAGMDTGSKTLGCAAVANGQVVYQSEVTLRTDVSKKMQQRAMYRRNRRGRKTRYRKARWRNRASIRKKGRIAPSVRSKIESHLREKKQVESILPITWWKVETASFDTHKLTNPDVSSLAYQEGAQKGFYNVKAYVLDRDGYRCQSRQKVEHDKVLQVHHKVFRSQGGTETPDNLVTLCRRCHEDLHAGMFVLKARKSKTKQATEVGIVKAQLKKRWSFEETYGYETKYKREQCLGLPKSHANDAVAICCEDGETVRLDDVLYLKRHVAGGDYQQTKGARSEKRIPTGKLFGLRKHDLVRTEKGTGFVKGKRSTGFFALESIDGESLTASVNVKKATTRLAARTTTLMQRKDGASSPL